MIKEKEAIKIDHADLKKKILIKNNNLNLQFREFPLWLSGNESN